MKFLIYHLVLIIFRLVSVYMLDVKGIGLEEIAGFGFLLSFDIKVDSVDEARPNWSHPCWSGCVAPVAPLIVVSFTCAGTGNIEDLQSQCSSWQERCWKCLTDVLSSF